MEIQLNGQKADIQLEAEKTVGDILSGLEQWLANTAHRLSGLVIDGETIHTGSLESSLRRDIHSIGVLDIRTSSLPELAAEGLLNVLGDIAEYENAPFEEKRRYGEYWNESPEALLLAEQFPELCEWIGKTFSGEGLSPAGLRPIIEERLRELQDPSGELNRMEALIAGISARLEELPLDIQTGKDSRAAETVNIFSNAAEKIFRVFNVVKREGFPVEKIMVGEMPVSGYIAEFGTALKELLAAYEQHDTVLVGDLAEYELSPRLRGLYAAIVNAVRVPVAAA